MLRLKINLFIWNHVEFMLSLAANIEHAII